jgi:hypothetical protein
VGTRLGEELLQVTADGVDADAEVLADLGETHPPGKARGDLGLCRGEPADPADPLRRALGVDGRVGDEDRRRGPAVEELRRLAADRCDDDLQGGTARRTRETQHAPGIRRLACAGSSGLREQPSKLPGLLRRRGRGTFPIQDESVVHGQDLIGGPVGEDGNPLLVEQDHAAGDPVQYLPRGPGTPLRGLEPALDRQAPLEMGNQQTEPVEILLLEGPAELLPEAREARDQLLRTRLMEKRPEPMEDALGAHPVVEELRPHQLALGNEALEPADLPLFLQLDKGHPWVQGAEVRAIGVLEPLIHAHRDQDAGIAVPGEPKTEVESPRP